VGYCSGAKTTASPQAMAVISNKMLESETAALLLKIATQDAIALALFAQNALRADLPIGDLNIVCSTIDGWIRTGLRRKRICELMQGIRSTNVVMCDASLPTDVLRPAGFTADLDTKLADSALSIHAIKADESREDTPWIAPQNFDYSIPTSTAYRHKDYVVETKFGTSGTKDYDPALHGSVFGDFAHIRRTLDYSWHTNYTPDRQAWQDYVVREMVPNAPAQEEPWIVFTCGAMGSGKGYVMGWLSEHSEFPLEDLVHVDPDKYKTLMPEWPRYVERCATDAGTMCHQESGLLQELCQEVAMTEKRNVWIDGSLGDAEWFANVFKDIRTRYPQYRIAIVYVGCSDDKVFLRAANRGKQTGRYVPDAKLHESINKTKRSISHLAPLADLAVKVNNDADASLPEHTKQASACSKKLVADKDFDMTTRLDMFVRTVNQQLQLPWIEIMPRRSHCIAGA